MQKILLELTVKWWKISNRQIQKAVSENIDEGEDLEDETVEELTMEALLELYENDCLKVEEEGLEGFIAYGNMKPISVREDSLTGLYICDLFIRIRLRTG